MGNKIGSREEYMIETKKLRQMIAFSVARSNYILAMSLLAYFWIIGEALEFKHAFCTRHRVQQSDKQVTTKLIIGLTIAMIRKFM